MILAACASLVVGIIAGLIAKPSRTVYSSCCGTTLGCLTCGKEPGRAAATTRAAG